MKVLQIREIVFSLCPSFHEPALFSTIYSGTLGHTRNVLHLGALSVPSNIVENESYELT